MKNKAPSAKTAPANVGDISAAKPASTELAAENKKPGRVVIKFVSAADNGLASAPQIDCKGIVIFHNPENSSLPTKQYTFSAKKIAEFPLTAVQLALFGASVHLRNQINTEKDEEQARANLEARLSGFEQGIYRAASEGTESVPLIVQALRLACERTNTPVAETDAKVARQTKAWHEADKAGKIALKSKLMAVPEIKQAFADLTVKAAKPSETAVSLGDL